MVGSTNRYLKSILNGDSTVDKHSVKDFTNFAKEMPRQRSLVNLPRKTHVKGALSHQVFQAPATAITKLPKTVETSEL